MRIGLVSCRCLNRDIGFNLEKIRNAMERCQGKADLLCFPEAFLQGFDALFWDYEKDRGIALEISSETIAQLQKWSVQYGTALCVGYIERDQEKLYSSCAVIAEGEIIHNYRRISKGWKEYSKTDAHYCEGTETGSFFLHGKEMSVALCGDLWDFPERFRSDHLLLWPVFVDYTADEWIREEIAEYAAQAALASDDVLMINPLSSDPPCHGGSFHFHRGTVQAKLPFDAEDILFTDI